MCLDHKGLAYGNRDVRIPKRRPGINNPNSNLPKLIESTQTQAIREQTATTTNAALNNTQPIQQDAAEVVNPTRQLINLLEEAKAVELSLSGKKNRDKRRNWQYDTCMAIADLCEEKMSYFLINNGIDRIKNFKKVAQLVRGKLGIRAENHLPNFLKNPS